MHTTVSVFAKPVGGVCGTTRVFPDILQTAAKMLKKAEGGILTDSFVTHTADRLVLIAVHDPDVLPDTLIAAVFSAAEEIAQKRHLFCDAAPMSVCRMTIPERANEPFLLFLAGSDVMPWGEVMTPGRDPDDACIVDGVLLLARAEGEFPSVAAFCEAAPVSVCRMTIPERANEPFLLFLAGSDVMPWGEVMTPGRDSDDACIADGVLFLARAEGEFPSVAAFCERFARRGLNQQGVCPVSLCDSSNVRTTVIPVVGLGFSLCDGRLAGPVDLFDTPLFDAPRFRASDQHAE